MASKFVKIANCKTIEDITITNGSSVELYSLEVGTSLSIIDVNTMKVSDVSITENFELQNGYFFEFSNSTIGESLNLNEVNRLTLDNIQSSNGALAINSGNSVKVGENSSFNLGINISFVKGDVSIAKASSGKGVSFTGCTIVSIESVQYNEATIQDCGTVYCTNLTKPITIQNASVYLNNCDQVVADGCIIHSRNCDKVTADNSIIHDNKSRQVIGEGFAVCYESEQVGFVNRFWMKSDGELNIESEKNIVINCPNDLTIGSKTNNHLTLISQIIDENP